MQRDPAQPKSVISFDEASKWDMAEDGSFALRHITEDDLPSLLDVQQAAARVGLSNIFPQDTHPFPRDVVMQRWAREITDPAINAYVCTNETGAITGFAAIKENELLHFGTALDSWGSGLAQTLHDAVIVEMKKTSPQSEYVWLRVFEENRRARRFYEKLGWLEHGKRTRTTFPPHPVLVEYRRSL